MRALKDHLGFIKRSMKYPITNIFSQKNKWSRGLGRKKITSKKHSTLFSFQDTHKKILKKKRKSLFQNIRIFQSKKHTIIPIFIVGISIVWLFLYLSPYFRVSEILIDTDSSTININRAYENTSYLRGKHILFLNSEDIIERLTTGQKSIQNVSLKAIFPNKISISLRSYPTVFQTNNHVILKNGFITEKIHDFQDILFIYIWDFDENSFIISPEHLILIPEIISGIEKNLPSRWVENIFLALKEKELLIRDTLWTIFIFDLNQNIREQIEKLSIYQTENAEVLLWNDDFYRDLRIREKIFICKNTQASICQNNLNVIYWANNIATLQDVSE